MSDFYSSDDICQSKKILVEAVDALGIDKWPKPPNRKIADKNKAKNEVNDILGVFTYVYENNLIDLLPRWVTINVENLPKASLEDGDLRCLVNKMDILNAKLDKLNAVNTNKDTSLATDYRHIDTASTSLQGKTAPRSGRTWADVASTPTISGAYGGAVGAYGGGSRDHGGGARLYREGAATTDTDGHETDSHGGAGYSKKRKLRSPTSGDRHQLRSPDIRNHPANLKPKPKTVIGSNASCSLKAARELKKNRIFAVSNCSVDTTCEILTLWLTESGIRTNNVFLAKTKFENSNAFRVNIDASDADKFTCKDLWGPHIIVRDWVFKAQRSD